MQWIMGLVKRLNTRTNVRLAILTVVLGVGGFAVYQGVSRLGAKRPEPVPKKVFAGKNEAGEPNAGEPAATAVAVAAPQASLYPAAAAPAAALPPTTPPPAPAGQYRVSLGDGPDPYANLNPYAQPEPPVGPPPAAMPAVGAVAAEAPAAEPPAELPPTAVPQGEEPLANPYRAAAGDSYGTVMPIPAPEAAAPPEASATGPVDYGNPYTTDSVAVAPLEATVEQPPTIPEPASAMPVEESYGAAPQPFNAAALASQPISASAPLPNGPRVPVGGAPAEGAGLPGERTLEGAQTPTLTLEKVAPAEIQVGRAALFEVRVRNVGQVAAQQVVVSDHVPRGTKLIEAQPQPTPAADGSLTWQLGTMNPGDEVTIQMNLMPQEEGEIGSVAQVAFAAHATARAVCTRPLLKIEHSIPQQVMIGEALTMTIIVSNPGTGAATGVVIEEDVPDGLSHVAGRELEYEIGILRPGESKRLELSLKAEKPGLIANTIHVHGEANLTAEHHAQVEVIAPQLQVDVNGPKKRFLERPATYTLSVANPGTAAAREVELVAYLPKGLKFVDTDSQGQYDPQQHAVYWSLEELPAAKTGAVKLTTLPIEAGEQRLRIEGHAERGLNVAGEQIVQVEAAAELVYTITDLSDPIEVGSETAYEIRVNNVGSKVATNIRINAILPPEMKALGGEGPTKVVSDVQRVNFEPLARLNPQDEAIFRVHAQALKQGDHILKVQLSSEEWPTPVTREESTRVYSDE